MIPLLGRSGCSGRECHGSFSGQGGFQLSLFGYEPEADFAALAHFAHTQNVGLTIVGPEGPLVDGIVDGLATISNEKNLVLYVWYDNEFGYSCQVVRVLARMADIAMPQFPAERVAVGTASIPG